MNIVAPDALRSAESLDELYGKLDGVGMGPGWNKPTPSLWPAPHKTFRPTHWRYVQAKAALDAAGRLIDTELAERRNLILFNPVEGNTYGTARTVVAAYQMILPGEWARSHRHTPNALRLILDAEPGTYTVVDGDRIPMMPGDVLLTPNWSSHGHGNDSTAAAYWLDFLDAPLVQLLEPMFFEPAEEGSASASRIERPLAFPWAETEARLAKTDADPAGAHGIQIQLGEPALDTIALYMMKLAPGIQTASFRTTANNIYSVVQGEGTTKIDGERYNWSRGDVIVAPAWRPHSHEATEDAVLFRVTDEPVLSRLGFLRTE